MTARRKAARKKATRKRSSIKKRAKKKAAGKKKAPTRRSSKTAPEAKATPTLSPEFLAQQWEPGQSGNPAGRPKGKTYDEHMREFLEGQIPDPTTGAAPGATISRLEAMVRITFSQGVTKHQPRILTAMLDRLWPKKVPGESPEEPLHVAPVSIDYSGLNTAELKSLQRLLRKASNAGAGN